MSDLVLQVVAWRRGGAQNGVNGRPMPWPEEWDAPWSKSIVPVYPESKSLSPCKITRTDWRHVLWYCYPDEVWPPPLETE